MLFQAAPALAQSFTFDTGGDQADATARIIQLVALLTVLSLAPSILIMMTSFTRIVVVLSFLRQALGTQSSPPNTVIVSLALFLTAFVMAPTLEEAWNSGIQPYVDGQIGEEQAFERTVAPVKRFMLTHVRDQDLRLFMDMSRSQTPADSADTPLQALIPAFMISELKRAFEIAFLLFAHRRADIWPVDDLAVVIGLQRLKGLEDRPTRKEMLAHGEAWRPWRSVVARLCWHYYSSAPPA
ncbi:MAG: hypothetical protein RJQ21_17035 [Rhodospirillales bacterium]